MAPWTQYFDLQGAEPPKSVVKNINFIGIKGTYNAFGGIRPNAGQTTISDITFKDCDVTLKNDKLNATGIPGLKFENVLVNGKPYTA